MSYSFTEADYEDAVLELFRGTLGYGHVYGPDVERDHSNPLYMDELLPSLCRINPSLPQVAINEALGKLRDMGSGSLLQKNKVFTDYLQNGIEVNYYDGTEQRAALVRLVDYSDFKRNAFTVINQWTVQENNTKRPDIVVFVNGLPVVVIELKSPSREETDASKAYLQLRNYMQDIPSLFVYNAFLVMSDMAISMAGTITANEDRFSQWKTVDGSYEDREEGKFDTFFQGIFDKARLLDIIKNFICFSGDDAKILAAYHQYFAVRRAVTSTAKAKDMDGRGGVVWHSTGAGKSLSMVFFARLLQEAIQSPTIVVLTDRNDLDGQLFRQFAKCSPFLRQKPVQAESRNDLKKLLKDREANGIFFSTIQKFEESSEALSKRRDIIVLADEAHRGHYGMEERVDPDSGRIIVGTARKIRDSLPNATYIGFTGTPISSKDRTTTEVFGSYIDIYDMTQSVEDGATRPVYYESRVFRLKLDENILQAVDEEYDRVAEKAEPYAVEKSKKEMGGIEAILGDDATIATLCRDIVEHYEDNRQNELTGKAMIVAYSRPIAMSIYRKLLEMRPSWLEMVKVVMTEGNDDPEDWREVIGNKRYRNDLEERFKDNSSPMKIAIVVDMWLAGFDLPSLATMYVYKPMKSSGLIQAISRVNRVFSHNVDGTQVYKEGGLVVDYVGIASALKQAMKDYTKRDNQNYGDMDIANTALPKFIEKLEVCRDLMHCFDYSGFIAKNAQNLGRAKAIRDGANFLLASDRVKSKDAFIKEALLLCQARSLCRSKIDRGAGLEAAYFEAIRTLLTRLHSQDRPMSLKEINARIAELLKGSIQSEGVINLFSDIDKEFSLFDPKFLEEISRMKERNISIEILKKLLAEQVALYKRTNLVKSEKFSEKIAKAMKAYLNGMITNEEVIEELMNTAQEIADAHAEGDAMGLSNEELAFYDALTRFEGVKNFYENDVLITMTRELTESLRNSRTIDWQKKESVRASMRLMVKRLLKKYKYPPDGQEEAIATVIKQCEMWVDG